MELNNYLPIAYGVLLAAGIWPGQAGRSLRTATFLMVGLVTWIMLPLALAPTLPPAADLWVLDPALGFFVISLFFVFLSFISSFGWHRHFPGHVQGFNWLAQIVTFLGTGLWVYWFAVEFSALPYVPAF